MKKYVCSLENAKRLAELGVKRGSLFIHADLMSTTSGKLVYSEVVINQGVDFHEEYDLRNIVPAYSVGELGEMLPAFATSGKEVDGTFMCEWEWHDLTAKTEADARAMMLIWMIENGHVKAEDLNG